MSNASRVQAVSDIARATQPLAESSPKQAIEVLAQRQVEACSEYYGKVVVAPYHPFVAAVHAAFSDHRPLVLSPDMFWLLICQGLARHVNANAEKLRHKFVNHEGQVELVVRRDEFVKGSPENPWSEVFGEFSEQIKRHIGDQNHANMVASFSTTGSIEQAANEIVLMDSLQNYFSYEFHTLCGIPEVTLEGTPDDWIELYRRAVAIGNAYELEWWIDRIAPTLDRIARNAAGADDPELWNNVYKIDDMSGGPYSNGWIVDFFPYLQTMAYFDKGRNELVDDWDKVYANPKLYRKGKIDKRNWLFAAPNAFGVTTESFPGSLCKAPFKWQYLGREYPMEFLAGFIGFTQDSVSLAVRPKIGWAVCEC